MAPRTGEPMDRRRETESTDASRLADGKTPWPIPAAPGTAETPGAAAHPTESRELRETRDEFMRRETVWRARSDALRTRAILTTDRLSLLRAVSNAANEAQSAAEALHAVLPLIGKYAGFRWAHAWIVDRGQGGPAGPAVVWYSKLTPARARFRAASFRINLHEDKGMLHSARGRNVLGWASDILEALPGREKQAEEANICTAAAYPADVDGEVVAIFEFFSDAIVDPPDAFDETMADIGRTIGEVLERRRLQKEYSEKLHEWHKGIARELHDDLGQELTGLTCLARALAERLSARGGADARDASHLAEGARRALDKTRILARGLVPVDVEPQGLVSALRDLADSVARDSGLVVRFENSENVIVQGRDAAWHLFRIAQEAVTNAVRHAEAGEIAVGLLDCGGTLVMEIVDDGRGLPEDGPKQGGAGIRNMRYRAGLIGAEIVFMPRANGGTQVVCVLQENFPGSQA
ncbi:MAG: histidine kinase [Planctomycetota bacterium]